MFQEVFHQTMSNYFFSHIDFIVKKFHPQFQKNLGRGIHSLAMAKTLQKYTVHNFHCLLRSLGL
jgi:hypothetical protein